MANLTEEQKTSIVSMLACFRKPSEIIRCFQLEFGITINHKQIGRYDPTRPYFAGGKKWRAIFAVRRETYLCDVSAVPIAHQAYRLSLLQEGVEMAKRAGNWKLVAKLAEQAAKEVGGVLTNRNNLNVDEHGPSTRDFSLKDRQAALAEIIGRTKVALRERDEEAVH
ncbi:DUF2280 domain-containing protein [Pontixanthobacter gangjinensis]|uniref:DUF2280 domain-containing protein n=1 Tax=Pontixanthobacter gangjinensis TaxID=1028742 RepID=A0A6I4SK56_9SPHN|nr:DUF2280 domain-containing protein [Pontixanthobacter gangjinensis]MXO55828.1 DUF2280 domain-containing protein [Pontixanthobacter gangjinensis]